MPDDMYVEYGNPSPTGTANAPVVTYQGPLEADPEYDYTPHEDASVLAGKLARHLATSPGGITRVGDISDGTGHHQSFLTAVNSWRAESRTNPTWVWSSNPDFAKLLGEFFGCPVGRPGDVEVTHYTAAGAPGVGPPADVAPPEAAPAPEVTP